MNFVQSSGSLFDRNIQGGWSHTNSTKYVLSYPHKYIATAQQGQVHCTVNISSAEWPATCATRLHDTHLVTLYMLVSYSNQIQLTFIDRT